MDKNHEELPAQLTETIAAVAKSVGESVGEKLADAIKAQSDAAGNAVTESVKNSLNGLAGLFPKPEITAKRWKAPDGWKGNESDLHASAKFLLMRQYAADPSRSADFVKLQTELTEQGHLKLHSSGNPASAGFLFPEGFSTTVIDLAEMYGVFPQLGQSVSITVGNSLKVPRLDSGFTAYWVGEGSAATESTLTGGDINLQLRGLGALAKYTRELDSASAVALTPIIAKKFAESFAYAKDNAFLNGDGTSTYGGITGLRQRIIDRYTSTTDNSVGVIIATGNAHSEITLADLRAVKNLLRPRFQTGAAWVMSRDVYSVAEGLAHAAGGLTAGEIINGVQQLRLFGYPVIISELMPSTNTNSQVSVLFGNYAQGAFYATSGGMTIETWNQNSTDAVERKITTTAFEQLDYNVFGEGTAALGGAYVALRMKAS